jgi:hypothetical protein
MGANAPDSASLSNHTSIAAQISVRTLPVFRPTCGSFPNFWSSGAPTQHYVVDHLNELACTRVVMYWVEVLDVASSSTNFQVPLRKPGYCRRIQPLAVAEESACGPCERYSSNFSGRPGEERTRNALAPPLRRASRQRIRELGLLPMRCPKVSILLDSFSGTAFRQHLRIGQTTSRVFFPHPCKPCASISAFCRTL